MEDAALVAVYAGSYDKSGGATIPVALTFAHFYSRCVLAAATGANANQSSNDQAGMQHAAADDEAVPAGAAQAQPFSAEVQLPDKAYKVAPGLMAKAETPAAFK
jgi:large exoprotein involved in heme utilization and adhesion